MSIVRFLLVTALIAVVVVVARRTYERAAVVGTSGGTVTPGRFGNGSRRVAPVSPGFRGCPAQGDGGDREQNVLQDRVDHTDWGAAACVFVLGCLLAGG